MLSGCGRWDDVEGASWFGKHFLEKLRKQNITLYCCLCLLNFKRPQFTSCHRSCCAGSGAVMDLSCLEHSSSPCLSLTCMHSHTQNLFCTECPGRFRQVLQKCTRIWSPEIDGPAAGEDLPSKCGFRSFLFCFVLFFRFLENKVINKIISLLHTLWLTNLGDKRENKNQSQENRKLLPIQLVNEFLYVLVTLIKHIR